MITGMSVIDTTLMRRIGGQLGSNPGGIYQDESGQRYYVKTLESPAHACNEWLAAQLYLLAGAPTLNYVRTRAPDQIATELVSLDKRQVAHLSDIERRQARHWLGVHAWTANWDAAGFHGDNQGVAQGRVLTLDVGGALDFRARGDPKGRAFGCQVGELDSLRANPDNPHACSLFGGMDQDELAAAICVVTRLPDDRIRALILAAGGRTALADKMIARKGDMARRLAGLVAA
ncbi:hypothetical protein [Zoogloea dura]|jgi:hypothetical protein|uniref:Uncharacterized protein n=1 Tax=Zoogloea dura TaxID=2728840 RepID=A0A848G862_9RHOO|nr:hypothetical protein [Zoogloea dura]NML27609.1 hypothetical protein [Zoogloea dura]